MRILFFNYEYPPLGGGAGNATFYILREMTDIPDLTVDLVTSSHDGKFHLEKIGERITVHKLPVADKTNNLHFQSQRDLLAYSWKAYFYSQKLIREHAYDLSHSFFTVPCGFLSWRISKKFGLPYIVSLRGADVPGYAERFAVIYKFLSPVIMRIWRDASQVVSNSQGLKELALKTNPGQPISIIPNGINTEEFKPDYSVRDKDRFIITPGASRITSRKGLKHLIEAVAILAPKHPAIFLEIMGDGNQKEELERLASALGIAEKVRFVGRVAHEETALYYRRASLFVLPSLNEGMSNAMLEALASGLPIVATRTGGAEEIIEEGRNGFFVKTADSRDIAEKIEKFIADPALVAHFSGASAEKAATMSWKKVAEKYFAAYQEISR